MQWTARLEARASQDEAKITEPVPIGPGWASGLPQVFDTPSSDLDRSPPPLPAQQPHRPQYVPHAANLRGSNRGHLDLETQCLCP